MLACRICCKRGVGWSGTVGCGRKNPGQRRQDKLFLPGIICLFHRLEGGAECYLEEAAGSLTLDLILVDIACGTRVQHILKAVAVILPKIPFLLTVAKILRGETEHESPYETLYDEGFAKQKT